MRRDGTVLSKTRSGKGYKPGGTYYREDNDLQAVVDFATKDFNDPKNK